MYPFVFQTSFYTLRWENVMIIFGIVASMLLANYRARHKGEAYQTMLLDLYFWLILAGIAGARLWEMVFTWDRYTETPWDRFAFWNGGMSVQGAVLGGLAAALLFAWRRRLRVWELLDILAPSVLLGQAIGRIGCLLSGDAFGRPIAEVPWLPPGLGVVYAPETPAWYAFGKTPLVPAEGFELVLDLVILAFLLRYRPRNSVPGRIMLLYGILYSAARFGLEFLRADSLQIAGLKVAQALALTTIACCTLLLVGRFSTSTKKAAG